jgi:hypothetical protein
VNADRVPWDWLAIMADFSADAPKEITTSKLRNRMIRGMKLAGLFEGDH